MQRVEGVDSGKASPRQGPVAVASRKIQNRERIAFVLLLRKRNSGEDLADLVWRPGRGDFERG